MTIRPLLSLTLLACAGTAVAADGGSWDFYVRGQVSGGLLALDGDAKYADQGVPGTSFSVSDVGLDDSEVSPNLELGVGTPLFDFHAFLGYQSWSTEGSKTLTQQIDFGGETYTAGANVASKAEVEDLYLEVNWSPIALNVAGFSIGLAAHQLSIMTSLNAPGISAKIDETGVLPMLALRGYVAPLDMLEIEAMFHGLAVPAGDIEGSAIYAQIQAAYYPMENFGVIAGYRHAALDVEIDDGARKAEANVTLSGPFLGLAAQF